MAIFRAQIFVLVIVAGPSFAQGYDWVNDPEGYRQHPEYVNRFNVVAPNCVQQELTYVSDILVNYSMYIRNVLSNPELLDQQILDSLTTLSPFCLQATRSVVEPYFSSALARSMGVLIPPGYSLPLRPSPYPDSPVIGGGGAICDARTCVIP
ncbi:hypothetical protein ROLI_005820 [Roseobacter fucihabitans]|uniref:Uncharacterized protein n=1 Tax=Roseobacter fucihabitans TaxID=1537242 RepID=A0ABZ2BPQ8_9RHOB|nr:hypothetical protein [Roseobacter litoralis]MBC6967721.1 hypothetical protein [Roseobacter litoralis]